MTNLDSILKSRDITLPTKVSESKLWFSISHVWMWELDHKESWAPKNWCFWTMVLEKTLERVLWTAEIKPVSPKRNQSWIFIGRTDAEAEAPILWPLDAKSQLIGKTLTLQKIKGRRRRGRQRMRWLDGITDWMDVFAWSLGVGDGQGCLACCNSWGLKEPDTTERLNLLTYLLLGRKAMTNLDSILKSRDITFSTNIYLVKAMVFPVVMYGCENWTIKKAECWRSDAFELWC